MVTASHPGLARYNLAAKAKMTEIKTMANLRIIHQSDLKQVNTVLSQAFSHGRKVDGFAETFFPPCRQEFLQMYLNACPNGCFVIETENKIAAAAFCHLNGKTGWIGPIVVDPRLHFKGLGSRITTQCIEYLKAQDCQTIGLETLPCSNDNLGFYGNLGFHVDCITLEMLRKVEADPYETSSLKYQVYSFTQASTDRRQWFLQQAQSFCQTVLGVTDYSTMIEQIFYAHFGDAWLFVENHRVLALVLGHFEPAMVNEKRNVLRILTLVLVPGLPKNYLIEFIKDLEQVARDEYLQYLRFRVPTRCRQAFHFFLAEKFRVVYSNVRMTLADYPQRDDPAQFHLSCWV